MLLLCFSGCDLGRDGTITLFQNWRMSFDSSNGGTRSLVTLILDQNPALGEKGIKGLADAIKQ